VYGPDLFLFSWREAFSSDGGPPATTRLVLWCLSKHMEMDGSGAFPSQGLLARESGMGLRTVKIHLELAERLGWVERAPRRRGSRASWRYGTDYVPRIPERALYGASSAPISGASPAPMSEASAAAISLLRNGAPRDNFGASDVRLVHDAHTSSSENSSPEVNALRKGSTTAPVEETTAAAKTIQGRREERAEWLADYVAEERRQTVRRRG
jgi:hypothetical protein